MFDLPALTRRLPRSNKPLRVAVRQLHWFRSAFAAVLSACGERMGTSFDLDQDKLTSVFVKWLDSIEAERPTNRQERRDFFEFVPSLVMRELIDVMPIRVRHPVAKAEAGEAAAYWPEAYVCVMFCLTVHAAVMDQEFHSSIVVDTMVDDLRSWWSFRENAREEAAFAASFFQKLTGHEPNWFLPGSFEARIRDPH